LTNVLHNFDKLYLQLYLINIMPEWGARSGIAFEAWSIRVETAEDLYATKTMLQRAGQYLSAMRKALSALSKGLKRSARQRRCLSGLTLHVGLRPARAFLFSTKPRLSLLLCCYTLYLSFVTLCFAQILHVPSFETMHAPFGDSGKQVLR